MATRIEGHVFVRPRGKYPWESWTDGGTWTIVKGEDYFISTFNMQISLHGRAKTQDMKVRSNSFTNQTTGDNGWVQRQEGLVFQFYTPEAKETQ